MEFVWETVRDVPTITTTQQRSTTRPSVQKKRKNRRKKIRETLRYDT